MFHLCMKVLINEVEHSEEVLTHITASAGAHSLRTPLIITAVYCTGCQLHCITSSHFVYHYLETLTLTLSESDCLLC